MHNVHFFYSKFVVTLKSDADEIILESFLRFALVILIYIPAFVFLCLYSMTFYLNEVGLYCIFQDQKH